MPRDGTTQKYSPYASTYGVPGAIITSADYNLNVDDVALDLNTPRPIKYGGTAGATADEALLNLGAEKNNQSVANFDSHNWVSGSFTSISTAPGQPVSGHAFAGIAYVTSANEMVIEARDLSDTQLPGARWVRRKIGGSWTGWYQGGSGVAATLAEVRTGSDQQKTVTPYTHLN